MNLVIDAGNTLLKLAVFEGHKKIAETRIEHTLLEEIELFLKPFAVDKAILSSVAEENPALIPFLKSHYATLLLDHHTPLPITNTYESKETLGTDRIACAVGAAGLFPGSDVLSIDAGTCIKYDMVSAKGEYLGGGISPGLRMRISALHTFTARLPLLDLSLPPHFIGKTTRDSMLSGAVVGAIAEVDGMIDRYRESFPGLKVVLSGGDLGYFEKSLKNRIFAVPDLVMQGLNLILEYHAKN
jgi:type III pantothenate kinase